MAQASNCLFMRQLPVVRSFGGLVFFEAAQAGGTSDLDNCKFICQCRIQESKLLRSRFHRAGIGEQTHARWGGLCDEPASVMAGLVPAIHVSFVAWPLRRGWPE
jgi:hypothetical protein